jgi:hypothetical protein
MQSKPIESAPGPLDVERQINWKLEDRAEMRLSPPRGWQRFALHTALFVMTGSAIMFVPSIVTDWASQSKKEGLSVAGTTLVATERSAQDTVNSPASVIRHQLAAEQERQRGEVLANQLALARAEVQTLTGHITALTYERTEAEKAFQTAQARLAEEKQLREQERQRGDILFRELASAREAQDIKASQKNFPVPDSVTMVSTEGSNDTDIRSGSSIAAPKSPPAHTAAVGATSPTPGARSDDGLAQVPEMAPPVSRKSGQRVPEANGQSLRGPPRENPQRMIGRERRESPRSNNYSSIRLFGD